MPPEFQSPPRIFPDFFDFPGCRALFRPVAPRRPPFSGKVREKSRGIDRRRPKKVPKGKVPRSVSQAAAVLRRSVPAGARSGVRAFMLQRRWGIRRQVAIFGGPPGPPPGRAPGSPENPGYFHFFLRNPTAAEDFPEKILEIPGISEKSARNLDSS